MGQESEDTACQLPHKLEIGQERSSLVLGCSFVLRVNTAIVSLLHSAGRLR